MIILSFLILREASAQHILHHFSLEKKNARTFYLRAIINPSDFSYAELKQHKRSSCTIR